jgi:uncharacterized OsmC-like protein
MEIHLLDDERIRLTTATAGFAFESKDATALSPFHLLAASLATCTYSVLHGYAEAAGLALDGLAIDVAWELGDEPYRVTDMEMELDWPELPASRREAARRAAARCTIHHTLEHGSSVRTRVKETEPGGSA